MGDYQDPSHVRQGLERVFRYLGAPAPDVVIDLQRRWAEIVGPVLADQTRPAELVDGQMVIVCDDPAWLSQIGWMEQQIIQRFVDLFPDTPLHRVTARIQTNR